MLNDDAPLYCKNISKFAKSAAYWRTTSDKVRLRIGLWKSVELERTSQGTVFILPGRSEYIEKYTKTGEIFIRLGYSVISIDWRGQGLSHRFLQNKKIGDVANFAEYQNDVDALIDAAENFDLPKPWFILSHSMGGCIALRAMYRKLGFISAAFTGPMWGIVIKNALLRPFARTITKVARMLSLEKNYVPSTTNECYIATAEF